MRVLISVLGLVCFVAGICACYPPADQPNATRYIVPWMTGISAAMGLLAVISDLYEP